MKVSVIIPTFNDGDNLISTLNCLVNQTLRKEDYEVIVCDDGSSENMLFSLKKFEDMMNFRYIYHSHIGFGAAKSRNDGIRIARSPLCVFLDSGMLVQDDFIEKHLFLHEKQEKVVIGKYLGFEKPHNTEKQLLELYRTMSNKELFEEVLNSTEFDDRRKFSMPMLGKEINVWEAPWLFLWGGNFSIEKKYLESVRSFDESFDVWGGEDTDLGIRLFLVGCEFEYSEIVPCLHIPHNKSSTKDFSFGNGARSRRRNFLKKYALTGMREWQNILSERLNEFLYKQRKYEEKIMAEKNDLLLVTGGAGFIGSHLVGILMNKGMKVRVLDTLEFGDGGISEFYSNSNFEFVKGDIRDYSTCERAMKGVKTVVHLASVVGEPACNRDKKRTYDINIIGTQNLLRAALKNEVKNFLFASSCSVYGFGEKTFTESSTTNPLGTYARTKVEGEKLIGDYSSKMNCSIMRFATAFGVSKRMRFDLALNIMTANAILNHELKVFGGNQWRPFLSCRDIAFAIYALIIESESRKFISEEIYNVGDNSQNTTISDLGHTIADTIYGTEISIDGEKEDDRSYRVSFDKLRDVTGFRASEGFNDGVNFIQNMFDTGLVVNPKSNIFIN